MLLFDRNWFPRPFSGPGPRGAQIDLSSTPLGAIGSRRGSRRGEQGWAGKEHPLLRYEYSLNHPSLTMAVMRDWSKVLQEDPNTWVCPRYQKIAAGDRLTRWPNTPGHTARADSAYVNRPRAGGDRPRVVLQLLKVAGW